MEETIMTLWRPIAVLFMAFCALLLISKWLDRQKIKEYEDALYFSDELIESLQDDLEKSEAQTQHYMDSMLHMKDQLEILDRETHERLRRN